MGQLDRKVETYKVALVVCFPAIVTQKAHRVIFGNVLGAIGHELFDAVPERGNGIKILVQAEHKAVLFVVLLHVSERVKGNVAEQLDAGFHAPVVLIVEHQWVAEEEARLIAAHVAVALRISVDDLAFLHVLTHFLGLVLIDPLGVRPMVFGDYSVVSRS